LSGLRCRHLFIVERIIFFVFMCLM
jgi:hypothetical protein